MAGRGVLQRVSGKVSDVPDRIELFGKVSRRREGRYERPNPGVQIPVLDIEVVMKDPLEQPTRESGTRLGA